VSSRSGSHESADLEFRLGVTLLILALFALVGCSSIDKQRRTDTPEAETPENGWVHSYKAGFTDSTGKFAGGSEILQLAGHKGRLYAAVSYWMDPRNIWYGGEDESTGWAQVVRLDKPGGQWEVDLEMGPHHLRPEILKSVTFTTDAQGNPLDEPVKLLVASSYRWRPDRMDISVFTRDDQTGEWHTSTLIAGTGVAGENNSVRAIGMHQDTVTGIDRIFLPAGVLGVYSGVYDPSLPGKIRWDTKSESGPVETRPLAVVEANDSLFFSSGQYIYQRTDGLSPSYSVLLDGADINGEEVQSAVGGIRGLTAIPNPNGEGDSLWFMWSASANTQGCIYRLDPDGQGGYDRTEEICLKDLVVDYFGGHPAYFVGGAFNNMLPVVDPATGEAAYILGVYAYIGGHEFPLWMGRPEGGFYAGALYAVRDKQGNYRLSEVDGPRDGVNSPLVAARAYTVSPFAQDAQEAVYFGGFVGDFGPSPETAWVFRSSIENALSEPVVKPQKMSPDLVAAQLAAMQAPYDFVHEGEPEFTVRIPGDFIQRNSAEDNVFFANRAFNSLTINVNRVASNQSLESAASRYAQALQRIAKGRVTLEEQATSALPDGTPVVEVLVTWTSPRDMPLTTQAQIAHKSGYAVIIGTHTEQGSLPDKRFFKTLKFEETGN